VSGADTHSSRASIYSIFISENGIVAVFGDEDQFVKGGVRRINRPLSLESGHENQMRGNGRLRSSELLSAFMPEIDIENPSMKPWFGYDGTHFVFNACGLS
jgi:hypothetical protein